jgi:DHA1 family bicyclomycin/chloramphenicol resistance-like MFS transporter
MATDMYLPAMPMLQQQWGVSLARINLTLVLFFVCFSLSLLAYGPLSDSIGRRAPLLAGIGVYVSASVLCSFSSGVGQLILFRVFQAVGAAAASSLSMAIAKDLFEARERQQLLAYLGVIVALAPMLSPLVGGALLKWLSWQWIFIAQAGLGAVAFLGVARLGEPLQERAVLSFGRMAARYGRLFRNPRYMILNVLMALSLCPMFAFIAGSPTVYISRFGASEQAFGGFFATNAFALMCGSFACSRLTRRFSDLPLMVSGFGGVLSGGILVLLLGSRGPFMFAATMFLVTFCIGMTRPISNNLVLEQVDHDVGAAASLLVFLYFVAGAGAMELISLPWSDPIRVIASMAIGSGLLLSAAFLVMGHAWKEVFDARLQAAGERRQK